MSSFASLDFKALNLKKDFYQKVVKTNIYKKRFNKYLQKKCPNDDDICIQKQIEILGNWNTTKNDNSLKYLIKKSHENRIVSIAYWEKIKIKLKEKVNLNLSQFVSIIDLSRQLWILSIWDNEENKFYFIGSDLISSGDISREANVLFGNDHYFDSPSGLFKVKSGWRSKGKKNKDNITLPYGQKNRYIYYFGKKQSKRFNTFNRSGNKMANKNDWKLITGELEFAVHAHQSNKQLGIKASHGCIRMSNELNLFLDNNFVLHKNAIENNVWSQKYVEPPKSPKNLTFAGEFLIIFDKI